MGNLIFSINAIVPLIVLMSVGFFCRKVGFVRKEFLHELSEFVFKFCLPVMLFQDISHTYQGDFSNLRLLYVTLICTGLIIFFSFLLVSLFIGKREQRGSMIQGLYRSNALIYGFPIVTQIYGQSAVGDVSMLMCVIIPLFNVASVIILETYSKNRLLHGLSLKKMFYNILTNPLIIGSMTGLGGGISHLKFPQMLEIPFSQLSGLATPMALFVMGGDLKIQNFRSNFSKVIVVTVFKLIIIPIIVVFIGISLNMSGMDLVILLGFFATPTAMASYIMAKNMNSDPDLAGQIVVLTTIGSCFTIFLFIYFLRTFGYL